MGTLTEELLRQVVVPIAGAVVAACESELVLNSPNKTGNLIRNTKIHQIGPLEFEIVGPPYALDIERGIAPPPTDKWTRSHRQRYHGTLRWVTRTYSGGQRPVKIPALAGDAKGPWRILTQISRPGNPFIQRSIQAAMGTDLTGILPDKIQITSLD
jgi:hypothetical protein|tara:strand:+ start:363 stop:830 length:468 start_codon:yes stop_codon:yes gene_type:complete